MKSRASGKKKSAEGFSKVDPTRFDFIAATSHGFRTHLTSIKGYVSLILEGKTGKINQVQEEFLSMVKESADSLHKMINNLLDLSKLESGRITMRRKYLDLATIIEEEVTVFQAQAKSKKILLKAELPDKLPCIRGDQDWVSVALGNLIDNAIKYTGNGGVVIRVINRKNHLEVNINDSGPGIGKKDLERVFEPFQRSRNVGVEEGEGAGLGLTIVRSIVEGHGGKIWVESSKNKGSKFTFTLPKEKR